ncbi:MAG: M20/M25/M40 family metallo-hydrolase [Gemmatimonadetes bacterium]|nr:M20/M25/M40 family metallo-hydrolase [Gemmatimonadota bacterium]
MRRSLLPLLAAAGIMSSITTARAQTFTTENPVLQRIWAEGMENSHAYRLAQTLLDSIGPRLTGSPRMEAGNQWLVDTYRSWGVKAENQQYGTWMHWRRGRTHIDLVEPRVRTLEGTMLAWSPGTNGSTVRGDVVVMPEVADSIAFAAWLPNASGKFVAVSFPQPTCRPNDDWEQWATEASIEKMQRERRAASQAWSQRLSNVGFSGRGGAGRLAQRLEQAGAAGVITSRWSNGWGVQKIFSASTEQVPTLDLSCEDYGLVFRLAENGQSPVLEVFADAEFLGEGPVFNTIATIPGRELPNEYVMLSAHFDSWDGGSGATDNGTGTITMLEAMRILSTVYPDPKRTILVGHWSGEEQGLNGSRAFVEDNPQVVDGLQALFNQDNGTGRVVRISAQGLTGASAHFANWLSQIPTEITRHITFNFPGTPSGGGSDQASFICSGAPAFSLGALGWNYGTYTWHTQRDTFDKISFDDLKNNATLTAMLVYLASEDAGRVPRERRTVMPVRGGRQMTWPECQPARRDWSQRR